MYICIGVHLVYVYNALSLLDVLCVLVVSYVVTQCTDMLYMSSMIFSFSAENQ